LEELYFKEEFKEKSIKWRGDNGCPPLEEGGGIEN